MVNNESNKEKCECVDMFNNTVSDSSFCKVHNVSEKPTSESDKWKEKLYDKYEDKGDERYGYVKHNNTLLQRIIDDFQVILAEQKKDLINQSINQAPKMIGDKVYLRDYIDYVEGFNKCNQIWKDNLTKLIK